MNIATLLTEKNNEYLKLLQACSKSEKALSDRLFAVTNDISKAEADLEKRVAEINAELTAKAEALIVDSNDEIKINVEKIKQQRDVFCANEEQRRADILKRYKLKLSQIEEEHNKTLKSIERIYSRQLQDLEDNYRTQLFVLSNSRQVSDEMLSLTSEMEERATEQYVRGKQKEREETRNAIEQELENYKERLKESLRFSNMGNQPQTNLSSRLIKLLHKYYECQEEVERPVGASQDRVGDSEISKNLSKQKIDDIYTREKRELEQSRRSLTDAENIEFEEKKERIEKERDAELIKDDSFDAEQKKFEATIESVTDKLDKELNTKLAELKTAYLQQVADFSAVQQRRIDTLKEDKRRIIVVLSIVF